MEHLNLDGELLIKSFIRLEHKNCKKEKEEEGEEERRKIEKKKAFYSVNQ